MKTPSNTESANITLNSGDVTVTSVEGQPLEGAIVENAQLSIVPPTDTTPSLPEKQRNIITKSGKISGQEYWFGPLSAKELKEQFRKAGHSGKKLTEMVNVALRSEKDQRVLMGVAFVQVMANRGMVPDTAQARTKTAVLKFVDTAATTVDKAVVDKLQATNDALQARLDEVERMLKGAGLSLPAPEGAAEPAPAPVEQPVAA